MAKSWVPTHLPLTIQALVFGSLVSLGYFVYVTLTSARPYKQFPLAALSEEGLSPKESWFKRGKDTVIKGLRTYDGPFQVMGGTGPKVIIPNRFAEELKNHSKLGIMTAFAKDFFSTYPGFETFRALELNPKLQPELVRDKITPSLGLISEELVEEATQAIHDIFGEDDQWQTMPLKSNASQLIARLTSRVFLGKPLCQDEKWLRIAKAFARDVFGAARLLRSVPSLIRPFVHWFLSPCIKLRQHYRDARNLITPEIEVRKERARKALEAGHKPPRTADTIGWMYELAEKRQVEFDYVAIALSLVLAAIHTSTEGLAHAMLDVCSHPDILRALREEVIQVIGKEGFSKAALYKLRLMDSFIKESQLWHPSNWVSLNRVVVSDIVLSDGSVLPAGARIQVANKCLEDPATSDFDAYRFYRLREQSENGDLFQHTSLSADHMPFGYGQHACPGRFMANTMMKISLCHLLLKYDWALVGDAEASRSEFETNTMVLPNAKIQLRRRKEEIDLARVAV